MEGEEKGFVCATFLFPTVRRPEERGEVVRFILHRESITADGDGPEIEPLLVLRVQGGVGGGVTQVESLEPGETDLLGEPSSARKLV